jgi:hypothetical protein
LLLTITNTTPSNLSSVDFLIFLILLVCYLFISCLHLRIAAATASAAVSAAALVLFHSAFGIRPIATITPRKGPRPGCSSNEPAAGAITAFTEVRWQAHRLWLCALPSAPS